MGDSDPEEGRAKESLLVERARQGDADAYAQLVTQYQGLAARTAYVITGTAADAEEAAQEGFVKAYYALDRFRPGAPFRPWLLRIVANEAINRRKSEARRAHADLDTAERTVSADAGASPEASAIASEQRERVRAALGRLRDDDRVVITYRYFLDLSEAEMADALGVARGTVKSRLSRAIARLREVIDV